MARFSGTKREKTSEENFSAHYLDHIATHADVNHSVIRARRADKNTAGPTHFGSLLDPRLVLWISNTIGHHPCGGAPRGGGRGRIFSVVKNHPRMQSCRGVHRFPGRGIKKKTAQ